MNEELSVFVTGLLLVIVKLPVIVKFRISEVIIVVLIPVGVTAVPTFADAQANVPAPSIKQAVFPPAALFKVTAFVTVTVIPLLIFRVALAPLKVIERQVVVTSPVRVTPFGITTSSPEPGTPVGDQVPPVFQFPVLAVLVIA
jgi:hypothetical protein